MSENEKLVELVASYIWNNRRRTDEPDDQARAILEIVRAAETSDATKAAEAMREAAANLMKARRAAELIMRDAARRREYPGQHDVIAEMHSDRAQAFHEAEAAIHALPLPPTPTEMK